MVMSCFDLKKPFIKGETSLEKKSKRKKKIGFIEIKPVLKNQTCFDIKSGFKNHKPVWNFTIGFNKFEITRIFSIAFLGFT